MLQLAATAANNLQKIPTKFWVNLAIGIGILIGTVIVIRKLREMNKMVLTVIIFVVVVALGFNWIYERNEPAFLTPLVNKIAPFFPAKDSYSGKQKVGPKM